VLSLFAMGLGLILEADARPARTAFVAIILALVSARLSARYQSLALKAALFAMLPLTGKIVDYGSEGWLWALFGLCQRMYADSKSATDLDGEAQTTVPRENAIANVGLMRLLACVIAAVAYIWQEQVEFSFSQIPFTVFVGGVVFLSISLCLFLRGPSRIQPPTAIAGVMGFIGRHTLEIYAIQLAASEIIIKLLPGLSE